MLHKLILFGIVLTHFSCSILNPLQPRNPTGQFDPDRLWVHVNDRKDSLIRSNPSHFWAWMKINTPEQLKSATQWIGQVTADPHFFNFGDIHSPSQSGLGLVDIDDSGTASLYLDFVRYSLFVNAYVGQNRTDQLFESYLSGLNNQSHGVPKIIKKAMEGTYQDLLQRHENWAMAHVDEKRNLLNKELGLMSFKKLKIHSPQKVKLGQDLRAGLLSEKKAKIIYDAGFKENDSGSSRGMGRFWYSLFDDQDQFRIIECKELGLAATSYYEPQKTHSERISDVLNIYSDFKTNESYVFNLTNMSFWCRPKHFDYLDRELIEKKLSADQLEDLAIYYAFWIGQKQSQQPSAANLKQALQQNKNTILLETMKLIRQYEDHVFQLK